MTVLRVAAIQHDIVWHDRDANFARLGPMIDAAAAGGAGLILLTETFSTGFSFDTPGIGEEEGGASSNFLAAAAQRTGVWVGGSCPEIGPDVTSDDSRPSNVFVLAGPDGTAHRYRKIHPFSHAGEERYVRAGTEFVTVEVGGVRLSLFVCYDLRFSDEFWALAPRHRCLPRGRQLAGEATAALVDAAAGAGDREPGVRRRRQSGRHGRRTSTIPATARSSIRSARSWRPASRGETILFADIDTDHVASTRDHFRFLQDRR